MRALVAVLIVTLAGCLGGGDEAPDPTPDPEVPDPDEPEIPDVDPVQRIVLLSGFGFQGCLGVEAWFGVDADAAQGLLPGNYSVVRADGPTGETTQARYRVFSCDSFSSTSTTINDTVYGDVAVQIEDPSLEASAEEYWYRFRIFSADDQLAAAWGAAGYEVIVGEARYTPSPVQDEISFAGYGALWRAHSAATLTSSQALFTDNLLGTVVWSETLDDTTEHQQALGTFTVPEDDPLADILPDDPLSVGIWSHSDTQVVDAEAILFGQI